MTAAVRVTPQDRLRATLLFSILVHTLIVLGVGFSIEDAAPVVPTLDVILTETRSEKAPEKADFLAASSQQGGGESDQVERPREPTTSAVPKPTQGLAPSEQPVSAPKPKETSSQPHVTSSAEDARPDPSSDIARPEKLLPTSRELLETSLEMARLAAEIERQSQAYAKRPKRKFISANTREYEFAAYMRGWVARVERIGNLNYPSEARRRNIHGQLVMTVAVRRDGTVERIDVIQPSGYPVLDDAAMRTVRLAEPFAPLPETQDKIDVLHITRTWQFLPGNILRNQ